MNSYVGRWKCWSEDETQPTYVILQWNNGIQEVFYLTVVSERFITPACTVCILLLSAPWAFLSLQIACIGACVGCSIVHEWCDSISLSWMSHPPPLAYCCWGFAFVETARLMCKYCCVVALVERMLELCFSSWCGCWDMSLGLHGAYFLCKNISYPSI